MNEIRLTPKPMIDRMTHAVTLSAAQGAEQEYGRFHAETQKLKKKYRVVN